MQSSSSIWRGGVGQVDAVERPPQVGSRRRGITHRCYLGSAAGREEHVENLPGLFQLLR